MTGRKTKAKLPPVRMPFVLGVLVSALLSACAGGNAPPSDNSARPAAAASVRAPIGKMMRIDKDAYPTPPPRSDKTRVVGLLLPLSDERDTIRALAGHLYNGAQLALFDAPINGGATDLVISLHDTKGTPTGAQEAAKAAIAAGSDVIVGPLFSSSVSAIQPVLAGRDVPGFAFSNDARTAMDGLWLLGFLPEQNIDRIVSEAIAQGLTRFGALVPEGLFGERIGASFAASVDRFGGTIVQSETYPPDAQGMFDPVRRLARFDQRKAAHEGEMARLVQEALTLLPRRTDPETGLNIAPPEGTEAVFKSLGDDAPELLSAYEALSLVETLGDIPYDAVFMPEGGLALRNLAPLLPYFDIDPRRVKFIGTGLWDDPTLSQEPPLHGGWYAAAPNKNWSGFAARYEKTYGAAPPRLASMAYDAVSLAARLSAFSTDAPFRTDLLTDPNGFSGIDGIFRLKPGGLNERGLTVQEVTRSTSREISRPPASFVDHDRRLQAAMTLANALRQSNPDRAIQEATDLRNANGGELLGLMEGPNPENQENEIENSIGNSAAAQPTR
ncbi:penicillin-binding protein activator [Alphaproteobacteria bacterium]|nr:penicillin-binding protein activator [Alphaproteobacteria bacterium]MDA8666544.1 penicillin-binding protein activator [Alphaproteobacteria bacterium]MDB2476667.1 penicillin-binding protein activator [Alphaproteobacteria bacterium]MDB2541639.1 penicillin-binding protein activator [Alphaproteobacteria bacterium]MDB2574594.1 penicillin-binding protein activator [Alphaproteobacteria bacterium]